MRRLLLFFLASHSLLFSGIINDFLDPSCDHINANVGYIDAAFIIRLREHENIDILKNDLNNCGISFTEYKKFSNIPPQLISYFCSSIISPYLLTQVLSHLSIYKYCLDVGLESALILEDHAQVVQNPEALTKIIAEINQYHLPWDIIYTDVDYHNEETGELIIPCVTSVPDNKKMFDQKFSRVLLRYGTVSYLISSSGMRKILDYFSMHWNDKPYDQVLFNIPGLIIYGSNADLITNRYSLEKKEEFVPSNYLDSRPYYEMGSEFWIDPIELLTNNRFDVMAKYIYAKYSLNKYNTSWHIDLYKAHLLNWVQFYNSDPLKRSFQNFQTNFDNLLESLSTRSFDEQYPIAINSRGLACNGAHRIGACLALGIPVKVRVESTVDSPGMTSDVFRNLYHLDEKYLDHMAFEYAKLKKNTHIVCLFPTGNAMLEQAEKILSKYGSIIHRKDIWVSESGALEFIRLVYTGEWWTGSYLDNFKHSRAKALLCFPEELRLSVPVSVYLYECANPQSARQTKNEIRLICQKGNECIHINDTHEQTITIAAGLFNENSIQFMNTKLLNLYPEFDSLLKDLRDFIDNAKIDSEMLAIDTGSVLSAYGLRSCNDMDILHLNPLPPFFPLYNIDSHNPHLHHHSKSLDEIICNPQSHFYYQGLKFVSLDLVKQMKMNRGSEKDWRDIELIDSLQ